MSPVVAPCTNRGAVITGDRLSGGSGAPDAMPLEPVVSLHWLAATTTWDVVDVVSFIADYLGSAFEQHDRGLSGYTSQWAFAGGLLVLDNERRPEMGVHLIARGETCELYGFEKLMHIYQALEFRATRIDLAADNCPFTPALLHEEWVQDNVRTRCQPMRNAKEGREGMRTHLWDSSPTGDTLYMGSRRSTQFARCYDERGPTRFEMEFKGERAEQVAAFAINAGGDLAPLMVDVVDQFVAFIELDDTNKTRCSYQSWWTEFLKGMGEGSGAVTVLTPRPARTVERARTWIEQQVSRTFVLYEELAVEEAMQNGLFLGDRDAARAAALDRVRDLGRQRWDQSDDLLVDMFRVSHGDKQVQRVAEREELDQRRSRNQALLAEREKARLRSRQQALLRTAAA